MICMVLNNISIYKISLREAYIISGMNKYSNKLETYLVKVGYSQLMENACDKCVASCCTITSLSYYSIDERNLLCRRITSKNGAYISANLKLEDKMSLLAISFIRIMGISSIKR